MTIKQWKKDAVPTRKGWVNPQTGEVLKVQKFTQEQLDNYHGQQLIQEPVLQEDAGQLLTAVSMNNINMINDEVEETSKENLNEDTSKKKRKKSKK